MRGLDPKFEVKLRELAARETWHNGDYEGYDSGYGDGQTNLTREILKELEEN